MSKGMYNQTWNIYKGDVEDILKDTFTDPDQLAEIEKDILDILGIKLYDPEDPSNYSDDLKCKDYFALYLLTHSSEDCADLIQNLYGCEWNCDKDDEHGVNVTRKEWLNDIKIWMFGHDDFFIDPDIRELITKKLDCCTGEVLDLMEEYYG